MYKLTKEDLYSKICFDKVYIEPTPPALTGLTRQDVLEIRDGIFKVIESGTGIVKPGPMLYIYNTILAEGSPYEKLNALISEACELLVHNRRLGAPAGQAGEYLEVCEKVVMKVAATVVQKNPWMKRGLNQQQIEYLDKLIGELDMQTQMPPGYYQQPMDPNQQAYLNQQYAMAQQQVYPQQQYVQPYSYQPMPQQAYGHQQPMPLQPYASIATQGAHPMVSRANNRPESSVASTTDTVNDAEVEVMVGVKPKHVEATQPPPNQTYNYTAVESEASSDKGTENTKLPPAVVEGYNMIEREDGGYHYYKMLYKDSEINPKMRRLFKELDGVVDHPTAVPPAWNTVVEAAKSDDKEVNNYKIVNLGSSTRMPAYSLREAMVAAKRHLRNEIVPKDKEDENAFDTNYVLEANFNLKILVNDSPEDYAVHQRILMCTNKGLDEFVEGYKSIRKQFSEEAYRIVVDEINRIVKDYLMYNVNLGGYPTDLADDYIEMVAAIKDINGEKVVDDVKNGMLFAIKNGITVYLNSKKSVEHLIEGKPKEQLNEWGLATPCSAIRVPWNSKDIDLMVLEDHGWLGDRFRSDIRDLCLNFIERTMAKSANEEIKGTSIRYFLVTEDAQGCELFINFASQSSIIVKSIEL